MKFFNSKGNTIEFNLPFLKKGHRFIYAPLSGVITALSTVTNDKAVTANNIIEKPNSE